MQMSAVQSIAVGLEAQRQELEKYLTLSGSSFTYQQQQFEAAIAAYGLDYTSSIHWDPLTIKSGSSVVLSTTSDAGSDLPLQIVKTDRFDQFKEWIGTSDEQFEQGIFQMREEMPSAPWQRQINHISDLTPIEQENIHKAGRVYLFGNSKLVESYKAVIEQLNAPFEAALYAISRVVIEPGASLIVEGNRPVILLFGEIDIVEGGNIKLYVPTNMTIQRLRKLSVELE